MVVQYPAELRASPEEIGRITIPASAGARIPLAQLADIRLEGGPVQVSRERAQRLVLVQANVQGRDLGGFAADVQAAVAREVRLPAGVFVGYGGEFENQARAMDRLRIVVPISIALIAGLLYASLRSWPLAGLILVNLPFAAVGGVAALWLRGLPSQRLRPDRLHRALRRGSAQRPRAPEHRQRQRAAGQPLARGSIRSARDDSGRCS